MHDRVISSSPLERRLPPHLRIPLRVASLGCLDLQRDRFAAERYPKVRLARLAEVNWSPFTAALILESCRACVPFLDLARRPFLLDRLGDRVKQALMRRRLGPRRDRGFVSLGGGEGGVVSLAGLLPASDEGEFIKGVAR